MTFGVTMNEKLSAFVDNDLSELEERRVLAELERDPALRATWERYHLIRAALRNELKDAAATNVSAAVASAIAREPTNRNRRALAVTVGKTLGGLAIAATVAAVAILMVRTPVTPPAEIAAAPKASLVGTSIVPVSDGARPVAPLAADSLNAYLLEHSEFAPTAGMGNMLPYVRTVNHDNNQ